MKTAQKPFAKMSLDELREATREFDREMPRVPVVRQSELRKARLDLALGRITPVEAREIAARHRAGHGKNGLSKTRVTIPIQKSLLSRADAWGKRRNLSRADVIKRGLKLLLAKP